MQHIGTIPPAFQLQPEKLFRLIRQNTRLRNRPVNLPSAAVVRLHSNSAVKELDEKTQNWMEKELIARSLSLHSKMEKEEPSEVMESPEDDTIQNLVKEAILENALDIVRSNIEDQPELHYQMVETPVPTPLPSPVTTSHSEEPNVQCEDLAECRAIPEPLKSPLPKVNDRFCGGGKIIELMDLSTPSSFSDADEIPTPNHSPTSEENPANRSPMVSPPLPSTSSSAMSLPKIPEEPVNQIDEMTQTSPPRETIRPGNVPKSLKKLSSNVCQIHKLEISKATSSIMSPEPEFASVSSPLFSSISEGEWLNLRPWQSRLPFARHESEKNRPSEWNSISDVTVDVELVDGELAQEPTSEGEMFFANLKTSFLDSNVVQLPDYSSHTVPFATPSSLQPATALSTSDGAPSFQPQRGSHFTFSGPEMPSLAQINFLSSSQTIPRPHSPVNQRIPIIHIPGVDSSSWTSEDVLFLNALHNVFMPAEPGIVPQVQSMDHTTRRQYLERLVSEGEIQASYLVCQQRASDPNSIPNWGKSQADTAKKTISAPGLQSYMPYVMDENKLASLHHMSEILSARKLAVASARDIAELSARDIGELSAIDIEELSARDIGKLRNVVELAENLQLEDKEDSESDEINFEAESFLITNKPAILQMPLVTLEPSPTTQTSSVSLGGIRGTKRTSNPSTLSLALPSTSTTVFKSPAEVGQDANKIKSRKNMHKKSGLKGSQDELLEGASTSSGSMSMKNFFTEVFPRRGHILPRPSPGIILDESFHGPSKIFHGEMGRVPFKESSGNVMMSSLGTIDEESFEGLYGNPKKKLPSSDSEGEEDSRAPIIVEHKFAKAIDKSISHNTDLSEGQVPPRVTRSHQ